MGCHLFISSGPGQLVAILRLGQIVEHGRRGLPVVSGQDTRSNEVLHESMIESVPTAVLHLLIERFSSWVWAGRAVI